MGLETYGYLAHHGIKGQKWGIRRFQNPDGTLTEEGRRRYGYSVERGRQAMAKGETIGSTIASGVTKQAAFQLGKLGVDSVLSLAGGYAYGAVVSGIIPAATYTMATGALGVAGLVGGGVFLTATAVNAVKTARKSMDISRAKKVK